MQIKSVEDIAEKKKKLKRKQIEEERREKGRYFKDNFRHGSTTLLKHNGEFFIWGDISHCCKDNIFHNARKIKSLMEKKGMIRGHMNYDDPPTFYSGSASPTGFEFRIRGT
ncbi:MAG: hypothetical protein JRJ45_01545 [Deltaproteobacteria bacterium]|nr:hypothetical protein [Deltaproteobacteria bacterium]